MVSNTGLIKSLHWGKEKLLKQVIRSNNYPYYFVGLLKDGKRKYFAIHRLVAMMFIPNPNNYEQIDHLDGNKLNNNVENLEWVTPKENTNRAWKKGQAKYTKERKEKLSKIAKEKWNNNTFRKWRAKKFESMEYKVKE
jgi:hypothetical protein